MQHALERVADWRRRRRQAGHLLVALDFDGTLAPIVERPEEAMPLPGVVAAARRLSGRDDTRVALVSGRGLDDVRNRLELPGAFYAGNHGMELEGPGLRRVHPEAEAARVALRDCARRLEAELAGLAGAQVEDKGLTLSVHYRRVETEGARERVLAAVREACGGLAGLRRTEGKMVVEVRPDVEWDKGRATRFLIDALEGELGREVPALYIGDDRTDEDAFRAVRAAGGGILVADPPPAADGTAASSFLRSPEEVAAFLEALADDA